MARKKKTYDLSDLIEDNIPDEPLDLGDLLGEQKTPIPSLDELPIERVVHHNHFTCKSCNSSFDSPGSIPQPVFIKTKLLKYSNLTTQQVQDLPYSNVIQDQETGEIFVNKKDNPWNPLNLPLNIEHHHYWVDRCINCVSGKNFHKDQMELFPEEEEL